MRSDEQNVFAGLNVHRHEAIAQERQLKKRTEGICRTRRDRTTSKSSHGCSDYSLLDEGGTIGTILDFGFWILEYGLRRDGQQI